MSAPLPLLESVRPIIRSELWQIAQIRDGTRAAWHRVITSRHLTPARGALRAATRSENRDAETLDAARRILPWRTGPFTLGATFIDSEWQSNFKWDRISPYLPDLKGKRVADIGASNGYFSIKLAEREPTLVTAIDPVERCWLQFALVQSFVHAKNVGFLPVGLEALSVIKNYFDVVVCMGVIYHQRDPYSAIRTVAESLAPGGTLLLESLTVPGTGFLKPKERYAKMRNAWNMPSANALFDVATKAGLKVTATVEFGPLSTTEQRRTELAPYESLAEFLDPNDRSLTVEGYPAPHTALVVAQRER